MWLTSTSYSNKSGKVWGPPYTGGLGQTDPVSPSLSAALDRKYVCSHSSLAWMSAGKSMHSFVGVELSFLKLGSILVSFSELKCVHVELF